MTYGDYPDLRGVKRILVIKMRHHGDVLLTSPLFTHLKKKCEGASIDALIYQETLPMLEGHPAISQFLLYDRALKKKSFFKRILGEFSLLKKIWRGQYDLVINLTEGDRGAIASLISRSRYKVGFDPGSKGMKGKKKIYTHLVKNCQTPRHTVERQLDVLRRIGLFPTLEERELFFHIPQVAQVNVQEKLLQEGFKAGQYLLIHPVSRWRFKCLPASTISQLIKELHKEGYSMALSASPDPQEIAMIQDILSLCPEIPVLNMAGLLNLKEFGALIQMSRCLITVDSVSLHLASALKVPLVALFGPSSDQNWGPWMHPQSVVVAQKMSCRPCFLDGCGGSKMSDCLHTLPVKKIVDAVVQLTASNLSSVAKALSIL
jgi:heptosyltransferase-3